MIDDDVVCVKTKKYKSDILMNEAIYFDPHEKSSSFGILSFYSDKNNLLSRKCGEKILSFIQYDDFITSIQFDEKRMFGVASEDNLIIIWDLETGKFQSITPNQKEVTKILIIPNNKLISCSSDKTMKIWDLNSYECLNTFKIESEVYSLCLISENQIACTTQDGTISIWSLKSLIKVKSFKAHIYSITCLLFVENSKLISCSLDNIIKIWNLKTFDCIRELEGHSDIIHYIESSSDGRSLFSCSRDGTVKIWQIETGELLKSIEPENSVRCVKNLNEDLMIMSIAYGHIQIYNFNKMEIVQTIKNHLSSDVGRLHLLKNGNLISISKEGDIILSKIIE